MQFHCLIYFDPKIVFGGSTEANAVLADTRPHLEKLMASGHFVASYPLNMPQEAVTLSVRNGTMSKTDGPFAESREVVGGFVAIEAEDMAEALQIASEFPHARLGHVEVRPAIDFSRPMPQR